MKEDCGNIPCDPINPKDELNLLKRQWQREALLEAADMCDSQDYPYRRHIARELRRRAKELE